jgi:hypothetical protein
MQIKLKKAEIKYKSDRNKGGNRITQNLKGRDSANRNGKLLGGTDPNRQHKG